MSLTTIGAAADSAVTAAPRRKRILRDQKQVVGWLLMLPLLFVNGLVILIPVLSNFYYSFTSWSGIGTAKWIGLANYSRLLSDSEFLAAFTRNIIWTIIFLTVPMGMALLGAFLLSRIQRLRLLFRILYFIPYIVATVVSTSIWQFLLSPDHGIGVQLGKIGVPFVGDINFLGNPDTALGAVALVNIWAWWGYLLIIFFAAMQSVNPSLYEAAQLDGANAWQQFYAVTLPTIRPTLMFMSLMTIIWSFLIFDYVYILTRGGPAGSTEVLGTLLYKHAFQNQDAGYAATIGMAMGVISLVVVGTYQFLKKKRGWEI